MAFLLFRRRARSIYNGFGALTGYEWSRNLAFFSAGIGLLIGLHFGFFRLLTYLNGVEIIGPLLIWKLTAMMMLTTFSMVMISSLLTSLTTLFYSFDMKFLLKAPIPIESVFIDKSLESIFYSSWMIGLVMVPFIAALARVNGYGFSFYLAFFALTGPYLVLASSLGIAFTLSTMYLFPSARTRDVIYIASSFSMTLVYGLVRFAQPERLVRPDALHVVAEYLNFLQAPTAPYSPSWWFTKALSSCAGGHWRTFCSYGGLLAVMAAVVYYGLVRLAGKVYFTGYSGSQEAAQRRLDLVIEALPEEKWARRLGLDRALAPLFWKERKGFFRDVKHWSQIMLVLGLIFVYLFSIKSLPLDSIDARSLISFLNIGVAGFVIAALGLRFTFPSISLEGRSWWVLGAAPVELKSVMRQKLIFSAIPMVTVALILGLITNFLLDADRFTSLISLFSLLLITIVLCVMGVGFGALFPMFAVENIHQVESSLGGFVYMAAALAYVGLTIMAESWPMHMHFQERFGKAGAWDYRIVGFCAATLLVLNAAALFIPWTLGLKSLETFES